MHRSRIDAILEPLRRSLRYGRNGPCFVGFRDRLVVQTCQNVEERRRNGLSGTLQGVPCSLRSSAMGWPSSCACRARPWPTHMAELPCRGARGSASQRRFALLRAFPWFSGLFSKHRTRMNAILEPLRRSLRYGRNGPCFVGFRVRLTLQTPRNVEERRRNELSGTQKGVPCLHGSSAMGWPSSCVCGARPWPTHMAELPCWGARGSAKRRRLALLSALPLVFGAFLEAPKSYQRDSRTVAKLSSIRTQRSLFRRIQRSFDPPNTSKRRRISPKRAVGDPEWGPLLKWGLGHGMAEPLRLQGSAMADPHGRAPLLGGSGVGQASTVRSFERVSFGFRGFSRSTEVVST